MSFVYIARSVAGRLSLCAPQRRSLEILDRITEIAPPGKRATVLAKKEAAIKWCKSASDYAAANGGKPWRYVLISHRDCGEYDAGWIGRTVWMLSGYSKLMMPNV